MKRKIAFTCVFVVVACGTLVTSIHADPIHVRVCRPSDPLTGRCNRTTDPVSPPISFESTFPNPNSSTDYIPSVLTQEWPDAAGYQALEAGAIAIRTFAQREIGCGAYDYDAPDGLMVLNNNSQHYYTNKTVKTDHHNAVQWTAGINAYNTVGNRACAKHNANNGDPTAQGPEVPTTWGTWDAVETNCNLFTPCGTSSHNPGVSQNGTHAWELSIGPNSRGFQSAPWTWQQMLGHYYTGVSVSGGANNTYVPAVTDPRYRWVWVNANDAANTTFYETRFPCDSTCERYRATYAETPATMNAGQSYNVYFVLKNTGTADWLIDGYYPIRLGYRWYFVDGSLVPQNYWPDNNLTPLPQIGYADVPFTMTAVVHPPTLSGWFILEWDLYRVNWMWFKDASGGGAPATQRVLVAVDQPKKRVIVYDDVFYGETTGNHAFFSVESGDYYSNLGFVGWSDRISSLRVPAGCTATLYEDPDRGGGSIVFTGVTAQAVIASPRTCAGEAISILRPGDCFVAKNAPRNDDG